MPANLQRILLIIIILGIGLFGVGILGIDKIRDNNPLNSFAPTGTPAPITPAEAVEAKISTTKESQEVLQDVNAYFVSKNRNQISLKPFTKIDPQTLFNKMKDNTNNLVVIDIREQYDISLFKLQDYPMYRYIRFGDLINNNFTSIPKDTEIVVVSFTENREIVASSYLLSQGYTNVKILDGGLLNWIFKNLPFSVNQYKKNDGIFLENKDLSKILKMYNEQDITRLINTTLLPFGPYSPSTVSMLIWDSNTLSSYISSLPKDKKYLLSCGKKPTDKYCWEAVYFWYVAKDSITIEGYTLR